MPHYPKMWRALNEASLLPALGSAAPTRTPANTAQPLISGARLNRAWLLFGAAR